MDALLNLALGLCNVGVFGAGLWQIGSWVLA